MGELRLKGVTKSFGEAQVIHPTDLTIRDGDFTVFVGPSGCGKSTMLRMIAGLEDITSGTLEIDGRRVNDLPPVERGISMVFQSYALYPHMTVYENIAFPLRVSREDQQEVDRRVRKAAGVLKLDERLRHKPGALSGGQRQRVAIGRAIVREPEVFLFDEPLSNLDAALRAEMRVELSRLHQSLGNTMIYVTHDQVEAMTMADTIVVLRDGKVEQSGTPLELYHRPGSRFVAGFIGNPSMNFLPARCLGVSPEGVRIAVDGGPEATIPVDGGAAEGDALTLGVRPDDLRPASGAVRLTLTVDVVERLGNQTVIHAFGPNGVPVCAVGGGTAAAVAGGSLETGFDPADAHLFDGEGRAMARRVDPRADRRVGTDGGGGLMRVEVHAAAEAAARSAADRIADTLRAKPDAVLGLATGGTMEPVYDALIGTHRSGLSFAGATTFNLDEYAGLPPDHPQSYRHYIRERLLRHVDIEPARTHVPRGDMDPAEAARGFESRLAAAEPIDIQLLGLGRNGHIGFNEPGSAFDSVTRARSPSPRPPWPPTPASSPATRRLPPARSPWASARSCGRGASSCSPADRRRRRRCATRFSAPWGRMSPPRRSGRILT